MNWSDIGLLLVYFTLRDPPHPAHQLPSVSADRTALRKYLTSFETCRFNTRGALCADCREDNMSYRQFTIGCVSCTSLTSRSYARSHNGQCKACATGVIDPRHLCPDCGEHTLTAYQRQHHYHCDACTRDTDPEGYRQEVMGYHDYADGGY